MLSAEELMYPRWELVAYYPFCSIRLGEIITELPTDDDAYERIFVYGTRKPFRKINFCPEDYPHLFKKLNWWEHRSEEDMPKKVICKAIPGDQEVIEVFRWDMKMLFGFVDEETRTGVDLTCFVPEHGYFPVD